MKDSSALSAMVSIEIQADCSAVWKALTDPETIKQYFFGTQTSCDWKKGSPIIFRGEWNGTRYEDKGTILDIEPERMIRYNYWSSMSGLPDAPEHYMIISYTITPKETKTMLTVLQEGIKNEESKKHSETNWAMVLEGLKKIVEQQ